MKVPFIKRHDSDIIDQVSWFADWQIEKGIVELKECMDSFKAKLKYNGFSRGRSALNIEWECVKTGVRYQSGMKLLDEVLKSECINIRRTSMFNNPGEKSTLNLCIEGTFKFKKQGTAYLLTNYEI